MGALRLWVPAEWRRRWFSLVALAVLVAVGGGAATALWAGARRADTEAWSAGVPESQVDRWAE